MNKIIILLIGLLSITGFSQQKSYREEVLHYFELNGTTQQYDTAVRQLFMMLQQQYNEVQVPDAIWKSVKDEVSTDAIRSITALLVPVYRNHFSRTTLKSLLQFYKTTAGKQMVKDPTQLTVQQKEAISKFYTSKAGMKVKKQSESLKKSVSEASELWSRDLYRQVLQLLQTKGYALPK